MPKYRVTAPDGQQYDITAPEGTTQEQALDHFKSQMGAGGSPPSDKPADPRTQPWTPPTDVLTQAGEFFGAIPQGVIGIPEAAYQYGEKLFGLPRPGAWADPLRRYQRWSESTWPGMAGEAVGNIAGFVGGGEIPEALGVASRVPAIATRAWEAISPALRTELKTLAGSQVSQPVQGDDFWTQKGESALLAHIIGRWLGRPTQQAAHNVATATNETRAAQDAADALATRNANAQAIQSTRQANAADALATKQANAADAATHKNLTSLDKEQHQALADAQERFHQQQREAAQAAATAMGQRTSQALAQRQAQIDAKAAVPGATTQGWWQRTLDQIGVRNPAATRAAPATGAQVRDIVGGRLNTIMEGMHLDPNDRAFTQHIDEIRDAALKDLPESERGAFYNKPEESPLKPLLYDPSTGKPLERTTRGIREKEPEKPTGIFYKTVIEPLQGKAELTRRELTDYVSRIGAQAEELARAAGREHPQSPRRTILQAQADALRNAEDAVIGHAAGTAEQKTALETARRAYFMWAIGNDAARASRNGVATPAQLISSMTRRLRGEARYQQALNDPASPYHDMTNWLQEQLTAHTAQVPSQAQVRASMPTPPPTMPMHPTPIPRPTSRTAPTPRQPPTPRPMPTPQQPPPPRPQERVWPPPNRPQRNLRAALTEGGIGTVAAIMGHPIWAGLEGVRALGNIIGHGTGGREKLVESGVRALLENFPRTAGRAAAPTAATIAGRTPATVPKKAREKVGKAGQAAADAMSRVPGMVFRYVEPQK